MLPVEDWPAEAVYRWHERVGMMLAHVPLPWPADVVERAEREAREDIVASGLLAALVDDEVSA